MTQEEYPLNFVSKILKNTIKANPDSIDWAGLKLTTLPSEIRKLTRLTSLNLSGNQLTTLPVEIGQLTNLTTLDFSKNQLTDLPAEIGLLTNLTSLNLRHNQLTKLPHEIGNLGKLKYLNISENQLSSIPTEIGKLTYLKVLLCGKNQLLQIPSEIRNLKNLEVLSFGGDFAISYEGKNSVTLDTDPDLLQLPQELDNSIYLYDFAGTLRNNISGLPNEILQLKNLRILDLRDSPLPIPPEILLKIGQPKVILDYSIVVF